MGGGIVLLAAGFAIIFVSGLAYRWVAAAAFAGLPALVGVLLLVPHSRDAAGDRGWTPTPIPLGKGFQTIQSYIAVGTGGLWGKGFMASVQKMFYLPEAQNDYIFAVIAEEQGLIGATVVLLVLRWSSSGAACASRAARRTPSGRCSRSGSRRCSASRRW